MFIDLCSFTVCTHVLIAFIISDKPRSWRGIPPFHDDDTLKDNDPNPILKSNPATSRPGGTYFPGSLRYTPSCRVPTSIRLTTLLFYVALTLLFVTTSAAPLSVSRARVHLNHRQSIPDQSGNTGNEPAPVRPDVSPRPLEPSRTSTTTISLSTESSTASSSSTTSQPTASVTPAAGGNGALAPPGGNTPSAELQRINPGLPISIGALAGLIAGGTVIVLLILLIAVCCYRRSHRPEVVEIPIRRSKLGSRLGRRIFGSPLPSRAPSRSSSRRSSATLTGDRRDKRIESGAESKLDKGMISRPKAAYHDSNGMLGVPRPAFAMEEREMVEDGEKWVVKAVSKDDISAPRPGRPVSAEPLGRLSGMGMGMGYLK
ncbi:hypothetical protein CC80DRAFT_556138 [Byssothecium circinans]|uniref:Mid2 domain-containing protein n=1 Tax=Byssothecium circinans TaxID=147558 RepID=A0A6A5TAB7_9PLEO|nr:hypothetical protein CC80DRAFT_556138 [Byssothecium circinans]